MIIILVMAGLAGVVMMAVGLFQRGQAVAAVLLLIAAAYLVVRTGSNLMQEMNPPGTCQVLGGHWDIWNGWRC